MSYGHGHAIAAQLAAWLPDAWAEIRADHPDTAPPATTERKP